MKKILTLSVIAMLVAGAFGAKDFITDIKNGTLIDYEHAGSKNSTAAKRAAHPLQLKQKVIHTAAAVEVKNDPQPAPVPTLIPEISERMLFGRGDPGMYMPEEELMEEILAADSVQHPVPSVPEMLARPADSVLVATDSLAAIVPQQ